MKGLNSPFLVHEFETQIAEIGIIPYIWNMTRLVFRNYDKRQIKKLLADLGKERYEAALQDEGITQKPLGMDGFFVEYDTKTKNIDLYYRYPVGVTVRILDILAFWTIPIEGWKMERIPT